MKIRPFPPAAKKLTLCFFFCFFFGCIGNHSSVFAQTFHGPSVSQNETTAKVFCSRNLSFRQNKPIKFENSSLVACWKEIHQFLGGWFGNHSSVFAQTFHGSSVSQNQTPMKFFGSSNLPFRQNKPVKVEILTLFTCWEKKVTNLFWADLETAIQFLPKLFITLQCHKIKLLLKVLVQAICFLEKTKKIWNFDLFRKLEKNQFFWANLETTIQFLPKRFIAL